MGSKGYSVGNNYHKVTFTLQLSILDLIVILHVSLSRPKSC